MMAGSGTFKMSIKWKLLASYIVVIAVCLGTVILVTRQLTLSSYSSHLQEMAHGIMGGMMSSMTADLDSAFRRALNEALLWGGLAALAAAAAAGMLVSRRITEPIHRMAAVTERIAAGDFSRRVEAEGSDEVASLARSLNRMAASLEGAEQNRRELMANIAHELRTPLTSISGYMEALADGVVAAEPETYELIRKEADRLARLVDDLQQLSRSESGDEQLEMAVLPLLPLLKRTRQRFQPQYSRKGVTLACECSDGITVFADGDKLQQVLINLLDNALRYTPAGGRVTLSARGGEKTTIRVSDTGSGIPAADLPHVFERFYRADKSRSRESGGSGIGLAIARSYVRAMGGEIEVASTPGAGTTFTITLRSS